MSDRAKEALRAESAILRAITHDGILHLTTQPALYNPLLSRITQTLVAGISITTALFVFTYIPQTTLLTLTSGPFFAPIAAVLLVLGEASAVTHFVARAWIIRDALVDIFDAVLLSRGCDALVRNGREVKAAGAGAGAGAFHGVMGRLGRMLKRPFAMGVGISGAGMLRSLAMLPLNFVPVVGTLVYVYVRGKRAGPGLHERYFQLRGLSAAEREEWVARRRGGYTGLGMASVLLEMVPFASVVFEFSNAVGAALWAADLEKANR
ncbi:hypothetical protein BDW62DRAFT_198376 [Aspergillus aurantiobrunneus]